MVALAGIERVGMGLGDSVLIALVTYFLSSFFSLFPFR